MNKQSLLAIRDPPRSRNPLAGRERSRVAFERNGHSTEGLFQRLGSFGAGRHLSPVSTATMLFALEVLDLFSAFSVVSVLLRTYVPFFAVLVFGDVLDFDAGKSSLCA